MERFRARLKAFFGPDSFRQPLVQLTLAQFGFLAFGILFLEFNTTWLSVAAAVAAALITELTLSNIPALRGKAPLRLTFPTSALAAALGIGIFLRATNPWLFVLAGFVAIASKYVIRMNGAHLFNPSNFAVVALAFLLPASTTIEFTQWGNDPYVYLIVMGISFFIAARAGVMLTTVSFLASYALLLVPSVVLFPHIFSFHHIGLIAPSLILFSSFMITDPRTAPTGFYPRIMHGIAIALTYFTLEILGVNYALFAAPFLITILNAISRRIPPYITSLPSTFTRYGNLGTFVVVCVIATTAYASIAPERSPAFSWYEISPRYILFGVESDGIRACANEPLLQKREGTGLEMAAHTNGAAWGDYDADGFDDLFVSNIDAPSRLYRNNRDGTFSDVTDAAGIPPMNASSALFIDYDNDGTLDLIVAAIVPGAPDHVVSPRVFKAERGGFAEETRELGLADTALERGIGFLSFADFNADRRLDMLITTSGIARRSPDTSLFAFAKSWEDPYFRDEEAQLLCGEEALTSATLNAADKRTLDALRARYGSARDLCVYAGLSEPTLPGVLRLTGAVDAQFITPGHAYLFENTGSRFVRNEAFTALTDTLQERASTSIARINTHPFDAVSGRYFQPLSFDYDEDGLPDILLATDFGSNVLLKNLGGFRFEERTAEAGLDYFGTGMGIALGDWNRDAHMDIAITNSRADYLYENRGGGTFVNRFDAARLGEHGIGWGTAFFDYDMDGWDDLLIANGIADRSGGPASESRITRPLFRTAGLYWNENGAFVDMTDADLCTGTENGNVISVADYDADGDPDVFVGTVHSGNALYENTVRDAAFLSVRLKGRQSNAMGIGARVSASGAGETQTKVKLAGEGYGSQSGSALLFGFDNDISTVDVRVQWPSGKETHMRNVPTNQIILIQE